ncbi:MAG: O-antigen ligase family protein [Prolixibacteraceae bacterium]|nr:O-antigen ligase family protein [Prolixibacteraceae bacterium]
MKLFRQTYFPIIEAGIALMIVLLPLSNNPDLMNGIQTAKSFNFFYGILVLLCIGAIGLLFKRDKLKINITLIDILLLVYVSWVTINKYMVHEVHCFSLKYYDLLGLSVLYLIIRFIDKKYYLLFLVVICISGTVQAIYGCLQLWGFYPSHHGLFKMTGSFFNPGPYAGFLCAVLPIAVGLYLSFRKKGDVSFDASRLKSLKFATLTFEKFEAARLKLTSFAFERFEKFKRFSKKIIKHEVSNTKYQTRSIKREAKRNIDREVSNGEAIKREASNSTASNTSKASNEREASNLIEQLSLLAIKYIALITIITILLVLPAARSRAAWLGAIAGVAFLAWYKYNMANWFRQAQASKTKNEASRSSGNRNRTFLNLNLNLNLNPRLRKWLKVSVLIIFVTSAVFGLYHFKKDSADGRMLIWKVTSNIIKDYPLLGIGQNMFKAHYMDYQAGYFRKNPGSKYETVADDNQYAFNEPLNIWAENGAVVVLLMGGLLFAVFFKRKGFETARLKGLKLTSFAFEKFDAARSRLTSFAFEMFEKFKRFSKKIIKHVVSNTKYQTRSIKREAKRNIEHEVSNGEAQTLQPETIFRATLFSILVFGLFSYPSEILPIKIVAITCLGLLANYFALNTPTTSAANIKRAASNGEAIKREASNTSEASIERERSGASNGEAQPGIRSEAKSRLAGWNLKPVITLAILLITIFTYPKISTWKSAHATWKDAMDLYNYGLYEECLDDYKKAYPILKNNGEFLINYGKALSLAEKHAEAVKILEQAKAYQSNTVLYTALGDSHKALERYADAEENYGHAGDMAPGKFYPLYLLARLYDASGLQQKALEMANTILNKEVKVHSTAIEEIRSEMQQIIETYN